jgi:hypothetical protein
MYAHMEELSEHEVKRPHGVLGVRRRIILQQITEGEGMERVHLAQESV